MDYFRKCLAVYFYTNYSAFFLVVAAAVVDVACSVYCCVLGGALRLNIKSKK